jgi:hypothetical protein
MQDEDIKLLRRIVAGGGRKYTAGNIDRSRYDRLVDLGWLTPFKTNLLNFQFLIPHPGETRLRSPRLGLLIGRLSVRLRTHSRRNRSAEP